MATMARHIDPEVADQIASKVYVDNGALAASSEAGLLEMRGTRLPNGSYTGKISQILAVMGLKPKFVAIPGRATPEEVEMVGGKFLGVGYDMAEDNISFPVGT